MKSENVRMIAIQSQHVSEQDMRAAMGPLYDPAVYLPNAFYKELSLIDSHREMEMVRLELMSKRFSESGPHREQSWSDSWEAVREKFVQSGYNLFVLDPPYVSANPIVRWMGQYIRATSNGFEMNVYRYLRETVFRKLMSDARFVHDVGAGSCFNSAAYLHFNLDATVFAYDWAPASQQIANDLYKHHGMRLYGERFDFYNPTLHRETKDEREIVMTTCAMEQLGAGWKPFLDNLMIMRPDRVVHIEPILEKYDDTPYDNVARQYHEQRNYLSGYYPALKKLESEGKIKIVCDHRTGIGSRFHECYTVLAWELI